MNYNNQGYGGSQPPKKKHANSGFIVPNDKKRTANDPDMKGSFTIGEDIVQFIMQGGREFWLSAWHKQARNPKTGMTGPLTSLGMQPKVPRAQGGPQYGGDAPQGPTQPQGPAWGAPAPQQHNPHSQWGQPPVPPQQAPQQTWGAQQPAAQPGWGQGQRGPGPQAPQGPQGPHNPMDQEIPF